METRYSPYLPIPPELAASGQLVQIKQAASSRQCSAGTLRNNAKAGNLRAFQESEGMAVLVLPSDVEAFLKSRPDITSIFHPKVPQVAGLAAPWNIGRQSFQSSPFQVPVGASASPLTRTSSDGEVPLIRLKSLDHATPTERSMVAQVLLEIFALIRQSIPPTTTPLTQNTTREL